ncbi:MAG TPA: hypothetical protein VGM54_20765 [Chthoniobacter sp.]|jgi:hypothetical protein
MSLRYLSSAIVLLALAAVAHAARPHAEPVPPAAAAAPEAPQPPPPPYELKNKSEFTISSTNPRPPFWPIGWVHHDASSPIVQAVAPVISTIDKNFFRLTSVLIGNGSTASLAVINGRAYSEGEFVRMPRTPGAAPNRVRLQRINDGSVTLLHGNETMQIPLRREELVTRHGDEKLLDEQDRDDVDPAPVPAPVPAGKGAPASQPTAQPTTGNAPRTARH